VLVLLAHLLFAQLTFVLAVVFAGISKASRWRLSWLTVPAACGLAWTLAIGPRAAAAGFAAGPAEILAYLSGGGHPFTRLLHPHGAFADAGSWLPRQFPLALVVAAAEAALVGWLDWVHTDEWAVPPPRPGALAVVRGAVARRAIRAGAMVTREGFSLGIAPATGARVTLSWPEVAGGVLVTGAAAQAITVTSLQVVHAALRRRKPVIMVDRSGDAAVSGALAAACSATGTPLQVFGTGHGYYEPFRHAGPARRLAMTLALLDFDGPRGEPGWFPPTEEKSRGDGAVSGSARGVRTYLRAVLELIDEVPADSRTPIMDDVLHLLNPMALRTRLGLVSAASPRRTRLAELVRAAVRTAQADPEGLLVAARRLDTVRASPTGRWLAPAPGGIDLARVIRQRSAAVFSLDGPDLARLVCADILALGEDLRGIGVDGDGLVWLHGWPAGCQQGVDSPPAGAVAGLVTGGAAAGLPVLVTTTSPAAAADLADLMNAVLIHRLADAAAAGSLAARTGTQLVPAASLGAEQVPTGFFPPGRMAASLPALPLVPASAGLCQQERMVPGPAIAPGATAAPGAPAMPSGSAVPVVGAEFVPRPAVPARTLLSLRAGQFVLVVNLPGHRLVELGQGVRARLPQRAGRLVSANRKEQ
jgi:hypothetical protein